MLSKKTTLIIDGKKMTTAKKIIEIKFNGSDDIKKMLNITATSSESDNKDTVIFNLKIKQQDKLK